MSSLSFFINDLIISSQREPIPCSAMIFYIISAMGDPSKQVLTFFGWSLFSFILLLVLCELRRLILQKACQRKGTAEPSAKLADKLLILADLAPSGLAGRREGEIYDGLPKVIRSIDGHYLW